MRTRTQIIAVLAGIVVVCCAAQCAEYLAENPETARAIGEGAGGFVGGLLSGPLGQGTGSLVGGAIGAAASAILAYVLGIKAPAKTAAVVKQARAKRAERKQARLIETMRGES